MHAFCQINTANTSEKLMCKTSFEEVKNDFNLPKKPILKNETARQNSVDLSEVFPGLIKIGDFPKTMKDCLYQLKRCLF